MHAQNLKNRNRRGTGWAGPTTHNRKRGLCVSGRCNTWRFGRVRDGSGKQSENTVSTWHGE